MDHDRLLYRASRGFLDRLVCPEIRVRRRAWSAFKTCGYAGLVSAVLLTMGLALHLGLHPLVMTGITTAAVLTFLGLAMVTKLATGEERLVYYHHQVAVLAATAALLHLLRQPVLPYLDVTILGVGAFLACGRVGCLMTGCCHGRPSRRGVRYRQEHADAGFPPHYVGVRLFPIQLVESLWVLCVVLAGSLLVASGRPTGEALAWYVVAYGVGRFCLEFGRGDADRFYLWGFSEAQWTSLLLACVVVWAGLSGVLVFRPWYAGAAACLALAMAAVTLHRRFRRTATHRLLHPHHVGELAETLDLLSGLAAGEVRIPGSRTDCTDVCVGCTSLGIRISASRGVGAAGVVHHYALSSLGEALTGEAARALADVILHLRPLAGSCEFIEGNEGVFHLLVHPPTAQGTMGQTPPLPGSSTLQESVQCH